VSNKSCPVTELRVFSALMWQWTVVEQAAQEYSCVSPSFARMGAARVFAASIVQEWSPLEVSGLLVTLNSSSAQVRTYTTLSELRAAARLSMSLGCTDAE